jgi:hypothetical protein
MEEGGERASRSVAAAVDEQSIVLVSKHHVRRSWACQCRCAHEFNVAVGKIPIKLWLASDVMSGSRPLAPLAPVVVVLNQVMVI